MLNLAKIEGITLEGDTMAANEEGTKRQVNVYFPEDTHTELQDIVHHRKTVEKDRQYSVTQLVNDAVAVWLMAKRYHKEYKSTQSIYDFVRDALKTFLDSSRVRK